MPIVRTYLIRALLSASFTLPSGSFAQTIDAGNYTSVYLCDKGPLLTAGGNYYGQLGNGTLVDQDLPGLVLAPAGMVAVSMCEHQGMALHADGTVWTWGRRVGTTDIVDTVAYQVPGLNSITAISMGFAHAFALKADGTVWAWGYGASGQLGNGQVGSNVNSLTPVQVMGLGNVTAIASGGHHGLAIRDDGSVWAWGLNASGQIGNGTLGNQPVPIQVLPPGSAGAVAAGNNHSLMLHADGTLWSWGRNNEGQLGDGTTTDRPLPAMIAPGNSFNAVQGGTLFSMAIRSDGTVWSWGWNPYGQLGDGSYQQRNSPVQVIGLNDAVEIGCGSGHAIARDIQGRTWAWGNNEWGQLGAALSGASYPQPVQVEIDCMITSIDEGHRTHWEVLPNPFTSEFLVRGLGLRGTTLSLMDPMGRLVRGPLLLNGEDLRIQRNDLPTGIYILHLCDRNGDHRTARLVAQ